MRPIETVQDLVEDAKVRTVWWAICIFAISYFLSHTSKSMWLNIPMSILILSVLRYFIYNVDFHWKSRPAHRAAHLSSLSRRQLSMNNHRVASMTASSKWKRKINSSAVEGAVQTFVDKIMQDFVLDLWYSSITPDKEVPELIRSLILSAIGELSGRLKELNLVDLLTRDLVDLLGNQLDLYRRSQMVIGADVMGTLSSEERDDRIKAQLIASKDLHPALLSIQNEYQVLQQIVGGIMAIVLRPQEAQSPLVRCFSREFVTCLVLQPAMSLVTPVYINELIEYIVLFNEKMSTKDASTAYSKTDQTKRSSNAREEPEICHDKSSLSTSTQSKSPLLSRNCEVSMQKSIQDDNIKPQKDVTDALAQLQPADWAVGLEAATKRRSEVLAPENLEDMWTRGKRYQKKNVDPMKVGLPSTSEKIPSTRNSDIPKPTSKNLLPDGNEKITQIDDKYMVNLMHISKRTSGSSAENNGEHTSYDSFTGNSKSRSHFDDASHERMLRASTPTNNLLKRSSSTTDIQTTLMSGSGEIVGSHEISKIYLKADQYSPISVPGDGSSYAPKIRCKVVGAYFEKLSSKSFAVYSISVTDADNKTWFVKRRFRNFEHLHRQLKEIPNYSLQLPPKRFLSSSIDDYLVHQRCILLDKYLQDILSTKNIAEHHEVWDFLSSASKNYSFATSTSVMKSMAVNVDGALDTISRQFKGASDGAKYSPVGVPLYGITSSQLADQRMTLSWSEDISRESSTSHHLIGSQSFSDDESLREDRSGANSGWHSDNEVNTKGFSSQIKIKGEEASDLETATNQPLVHPVGTSSADTITRTPDILNNPVEMPAEWIPPNVSLPLLNLVDKIFQLKRRGWLRTQVYWMSKQVLQLVMEDAIDDWILRQIQWLRREDTVAEMIRMVQDILWPNGTFFSRVANFQGTKPIPGPGAHSADATNFPSSFQNQLEASWRANFVRKLLLEGAPTTLVSLIGHNQYRRTARDIFYFLQSPVCLKQLAYNMLELIVVSVFPELRQLVSDIHEKARKHPAFDKHC